MTKFLALSLLIAPLAAHAGGAADAHVAAAMEAHQAGRFADALTELTAAYNLDPKPELLFALGQLNVKLDRCADAIGWYDKYLATSPSAQSTADTNQAIATCKAQLAATPPPPPVTPPPPPPPPVATRSPWYTDKLGDGLVIGGVVSTAIGVAFYVGARSSLDDAEAANSLALYNERRDEAEGKRVWSVVFVGAGVALIGAGIARYVLRDGGTEERGVAVVPTSDGGLVTWAGRF